MGNVTVIAACADGSYRPQFPFGSAPAPTFTPVAGNYTVQQLVSITSTLANATIFYTIGGVPTILSPVYGGPITIATTETLNAIAVAPGYYPSAVATATFIISSAQNQVATPTFSPPAGTYSGSISVTPACTTSGAVLYYTTNGTTPTTASPQVTGPITITATQTLKVLGTAGGFLPSNVASATFTISAPTTRNALGLNLAPQSYYTTGMPFLNAVKASAAAGAGKVGWLTCVGTGGSTGHSLTLPVDANGYPKILTQSAYPSDNAVFIDLFLTMPTVAGVLSYYPAGQYRLRYAGTGTIVMKGDCGTVTLTNSGTGYVQTILTVATPSRTGMQLFITATAGDSVNYPHDISVVKNEFAALYDAGAIFNPVYLAALSPFASIRCMDWLATNYQNPGFTFTGSAIAAGATSGVLSAPWPYPSQTRTMYFINGEIYTGTFTAYSTAVHWTGAGLINAITSTTYNGVNTLANFRVEWNDDWTTRPVPSNCFWTAHDGAGVPWEIIAALGNQLGANVFSPTPLLAALGYKVGLTDYVTALSNLMLNGTGMQAGFLPLQAPLEWSADVCNENWNGGFSQYYVAVNAGQGLWPSQAPGSGGAAFNESYVGYAHAVMAAKMMAVWTGANASRCCPIMGSWYSNFSGYLGGTMAAANWVAGGAINGYTGPPSNLTLYPFKAATGAPYIPITGAFAGPIGTWTFTGTASSGTKSLVWSGTFPASSITLFNASGGVGLSGTGIAAGTMITGVNYTTNTLTLSLPTTGAVSGTITADDTVLCNAQPDGGLTLAFAGYYAKNLNTIETGGMLASAYSQVANVQSYLSAHFPTLAFRAYESGNYLSMGTTGQYNLQAMYLAMQSDPRMATLYTTYFQGFGTSFGTTAKNVFHQFNDIDANTGNNANWGAAFSLMQFMATQFSTVTGLASSSITDTTQSWTTNQWAGYVYLNCATQQQATIASNTATVLTFSAPLTQSGTPPYVVMPPVSAYPAKFAGMLNYING